MQPRLLRASCVHCASEGTGSSVGPAALLTRLQLPRGDDCVLDDILVPVLEVRDDHVLREAFRHRERLRERLEQEIAKVERRTDDGVAGVELPRDQPAALSPVEPAIAATLRDPV